MTLSGGRAKIEIQGDLDPLKRDFRSIDSLASSAGRSAGSKFSTGFSRFASRAGSMLKTGLKRGLQGLGVAATAWAGFSVKAASDVGESINKASVIFGKNRKQILRWSRTTADAMGISRQQSLEAAAGFGNVLNTSGVAADSVDNMSRNMVQLAADMASFNNIDPTEALDKLRAGLVGEAEPLRQVGVLLSETRVKEEAYRIGLAKTGEELTDAQKVQARYNLILEDTKKQQGDFANTSETMPNQIRRMKASFTDLSAELGNKLLPFAVKVLTWANKNLPKAFKWLEKTGIPALVTAWDFMVEGIGNAMGVITDRIATFVAFWTNAAGKILAAAGFAFGWIPGIGAKINKAKDDFNRWSDGIVEELRHQSDVFRTWGDDVGETLANAKEDWEGFKMAVEKGVLPPQAAFNYVQPGGTTVPPPPDRRRDRTPAPTPSDALLAPVGLTQITVDVNGSRLTKSVNSTTRRTKILLGEV